MQSGAAPYSDQTRPGGTFAHLSATPRKATLRTPGRKMAAAKRSMGARDAGIS
jgi:hypothetical protein